MTGETLWTLIGLIVGGTLGCGYTLFSDDPFGARRKRYELLDEETRRILTTRWWEDYSTGCSTLNGAPGTAKRTAAKQP